MTGDVILKVESKSARVIGCDDIAADCSKRVTLRLGSSNNDYYYDINIMVIIKILLPLKPIP